MKATLHDLLECGLYFGHPGKQFDPRMKQYVFAKRQGVFIIDLLKTRDCLEKACDFLRESARQGKEFVFVGTKKQVQDIIRENSRETGFHYMSNRWLGGTLTNFSTIRSRISRMNELVEKDEKGVFETNLSKKEAAVARKEKERLLKNLEGLREITRIPDVMVVFDVHKEEIAVREARACGLKIVGVVDTNANPEMIDYPIPANDDGRKGLTLLIAEFCEAIRTGREERDILLKKAAEEKRRKEEEEKKRLEAEKQAALARAREDKEKAEALKEGETRAEPAGEGDAKKPDPAETAPKPAPDRKEPPAAEKAKKTPGARATEAEPEAGETAKKPVKPKPRPRIRSKYRAAAPKKTAAGSRAKPASAGDGAKAEASGTARKKTDREEKKNESGE